MTQTRKNQQKSQLKFNNPTIALWSSCNKTKHNSKYTPLTTTDSQNSPKILIHQAKANSLRSKYGRKKYVDRIFTFFAFFKKPYSIHQKEKMVLRSLKRMNKLFYLFNK